MTRGYHQHCPIAVALDELGDVSLTSSTDGAADLEVDLSVDDLVAARRGEPRRLPPGPSSQRFARLFQFEMLDTAGAGAVR